MNTINTSNHVNTLIITVGTRQIGWRHQDGIIYSFGADGNIGYPPHITELYQKLGIERGTHQEGDKTYSWSGRDLGQRYYEYCKEWLGGDFSQVELLLDQTIIESGVKQGLKHIILWGTDQPEKVSWSYRRLDTLWIAELMAGKIKSLFPTLRVDVHTPRISANDNNAIREELEQLVLKESLAAFSPQQNEEFVLWIQNKGCTPAVASSVEICAAALVRQCQVFNASPDEPTELFTTTENGLVTANHSPSFKLIPMGEYFWSLERLRIQSAWERGDFTEAQLWLKIHQNRHKPLYNLAGCLARYSNCEFDKRFFQSIEEWLRSNDVSKLLDGETIQAWQEKLHQMRNNKLRQIWESTLLIKLLLHRQNYTAAFIQFAQILERSLYIQFKSENWLAKGFVTIPTDREHLGSSYQPGLAGLMQGWCRSQHLHQNDKWSKLLDRIREKRNHLIHEGEAITPSQIRSMWADGGLFPVKCPESPEIIGELMMDVLKKISTPPDLTQLLLYSLYKWGLQSLQQD